MYIVFLKFSTNKQRAGEYMQGHMQWIQRGLDDQVFLMVGSLKPDLGGGILAHQCQLHELEQRIAADPFVEHGIVSAEIIEFAPAKADSRLSFLLD